MALKMQKELEMRVHEEFYCNVHFLTLIYPPIESFISVFKKDMFVKNNKTGFQQVTYYLLEILDKDVLKQKVPSWPLYDIRSENEFRNEVMKYVNELNTIYEDANIPNIVTSHLITPGGFKFIKFMLKLSQFVLFVYLQRNEIYPHMLLPIKPSKREIVTKTNIDNINIATHKINLSTNVMKTNFEKKFEVIKSRSEKILHDFYQTSDLNEEEQKKLNSLREVCSNNKSNHNVKIKSDLSSKLETLKLLKEKSNQSQLFSSYIQNPLKLSYSEECALIASDPMNRLHIKDDILLLTNLFESCSAFANRKRFEVNPTSKQNLIKQVETLVQLNKHLHIIIQDLDRNYSECLHLAEKLKKEHGRRVNLQRNFSEFLNSESDSDGFQLAEPLPISP